MARTKELKSKPGANHLNLIQVNLTKVGENPLGGNPIMSAVFDWVITDTVMKIHLNTVTK